MPPQTTVHQSSDSKESSPLLGTQPLSLVDSIPLKLVMLLASPYMAGKTAPEALKKAHKLYAEMRFSSTIDILGEDAKFAKDCEESVHNYKRLIDLIADSPIPCRRPEEQITVSFKPSMFSTQTPREGTALKELDSAYERIESIVKHAQEKNIRVTLEAEDHRWTDFHLETYFSLINAGYGNLGTVLQARLFRTKKDILRFDERMRVRMVIGIYNEPASIALTQKPLMKELAVEYAGDLLSRGVYVELASHDNDCLKNFIERAVLPQRAPATKFEVQHLLGVPRKNVQIALASGQYFAELAQTATGAVRNHLAELARSGALVRMYLPYGAENVAAPYCKRRLKANPNMIGYGIKNLLHLQ